MKYKKGCITRRGLFRQAVKGASVYLSSKYLFGCGGESSSKTPNKTSSKVDSMPYFERDYAAVKANFDSYGNASFQNRDFACDIYFRDNYNNCISEGLE